MTETTTVPVRRDVTVPVGVERAFQVFTTHFDSWWPRGHHVGATPLHQALFEPKAGGRWYEIDDDGSEIDWGTVLVWDAPHRLVVTWQLNGHWEYDADPAHASEVEVTFTPSGERATVVTLEHRYLERLVAGDEARQGIAGDGGWRGILARYAAVVGANSD